MNDQQALLAAVRESPEDDLPRLAFADWCDEHGLQPRAEFIRAQIDADRLDEPDPHRLALEDRADELLAEHRDEWLGSAAAQVSRLHFRRGFVESAAVECGRFLDCAEEVFRSWPLRRLRLQGADGDYAENEELIAALRSPWLARAESLAVFCDASSLSRDAVAALAECPHLADLRELDLNAHNPGPGIGPEGVRLLANSPHLRGLTALRLRWQKIGDGGAAALAASPLLPRLRLLDLGAIQEIGDAGLIALLSSAGAASLKWLDVEHTSPGPEALAILAAWGERARPSGLRVGSLGRDPSGRPAGAPWVAGLEDLSVRDLLPPRIDPDRLLCLGCPVGALFDRLEEGGCFDALRSLDVSHSEIVPAEVEQILAGDALPRLAEVNFFFSRVGDRGLEAMARSPGLSRLRRLNLRFNDLTDDGVKALAASPYAGGLRSLYLSGGDLGAAGVRCLIRSPHLGRLRELELCGVGATDASVKALCKAFPLLRGLDLSSSRDLTDASAAALSRARWPLLERLSLCSLPFSDEAIEKLRRRWGPRLELAEQDEWL
jgi:uncharacterized protein (TIGR02996 family)